MALNLRTIDPDLHATLKSEAAKAGLGIEAYCIQIFRNRKAIDPVKPAIQRVAPVMRAGGLATPSNWAEGGGTEPDPTPFLVQAAPIEDPKPAAVGCPHGWMNQKLCPACRSVA